MVMINELKTSLASFPSTTIFWIAYSGGMDSHVLLDLCAQQSEFHFKVIHVNHHLHEHASEWAKHCQSMVETYNLPFMRKDVHVKKDRGESLEANARLLRYKAISDVMSDGDVLLTAHHEDDQAETLMLQLMRGAGIHGLSAMPVSKSFANGIHFRPLLSYSREKLQAYALKHQLQWIEDGSNLNIDIKRNWLRHQVIPQMKKISPSVATCMARSAKLCGEATAILEEWAEEKLERFIGRTPYTLSVKALLSVNEHRRHFILRAWLKKQNCLMPSSKKLEAISKDVLGANTDRMPCVQYGHVEIRRYQNDLYCMTTLPEPSLHPITWDLQKNLMIDNVGVLQVERCDGIGLKRLPEVEVRFRQGGEKLYINGQHQTLKNFFNRLKIPVWKRSRLPLLYVDDTIICIPNYYIHKDYMQQEGQALQVHFTVL